jgi:hypothetical protein
MFCAFPWSLSVNNQRVQNSGVQLLSISLSHQAVYMSIDVISNWLHVYVTVQSTHTDFYRLFSFTHSLHFISDKLTVCLQSVCNIILTEWLDLETTPRILLFSYDFASLTKCARFFKQEAQNITLSLTFFKSYFWDLMWFSTLQFSQLG